MSTEALAAGWHEFHTKNALTSIAYVHENGDVFLPDPEFTAEDFTTSTSVHPLIRKPRTVTTVEELDALPVESAVRSAMGSFYVKDQDMGNPSDTWWSAAGSAAEFITSRVSLPATVLHEGSAE